MRMLKLFTLASLLALSSQVIASPDASKDCDTIAKSCVNVGYTNSDGEKQFWRDCMQPLLLNKKVNDVDIDKQIIIACRAAKITEMKNEIKELEAVSDSK